MSEYLEDVVSLFLGKRPAARNLVPFDEAGPAASGGGMLGDKDWMTAIGRLLAVLYRERRSQTLFNEIGCMFENLGKGLLG